MTFKPQYQTQCQATISINSLQNFYIELIEFIAQSMFFVT